MIKLLQNKTIGIVLPSIPGYSETFFRSKIAGLQSHGATVLLFVANPTHTKNNIPCKVFQAPKLHGAPFFVAGVSLCVLFKAVFLNFKKSSQFLSLEKQDGETLKNQWKHLIANHFILQQKVDWLHFGFGTMALGRENVAQAMGAKMAVSFRGFDHYIFPVKNPNCYDKLFSKMVKYHVLSKGMKNTITCKGVPSRHIKMITPAIDAVLFKRRREVATKQIHFLTIARLHWIKGLEYTLEALSILKNQGHDFHFTIIGDGPERERLVFATHQLGLEKHVTFMGKLAPEEVKPHLENAEIYIQYSIQEGFCNAALEAQAMGLLCVVSDAEGLAENVLNNETGWVVPKRNPELLAKKLQEVIALPQDRKHTIIKNAIDRVTTVFNLEKQAKEFVDFYEY